MKNQIILSLAVSSKILSSKGKYKKVIFTLKNIRQARQTIFLPLKSNSPNKILIQQGLNVAQNNLAFNNANRTEEILFYFLKAGKVSNVKI